jgi:hypothetical protein
VSHFTGQTKRKSQVVIMSRRESKLAAAREQSRIRMAQGQGRLAPFGSVSSTISARCLCGGDISEGDSAKIKPPRLG